MSSSGTLLVAMFLLNETIQLSRFFPSQKQSSDESLLDSRSVKIIKLKHQQAYRSQMSMMFYCFCSIGFQFFEPGS